MKKEKRKGRGQGEKRGSGGRGEEGVGAGGLEGGRAGREGSSHCVFLLTFDFEIFYIHIEVVKRAEFLCIPIKMPPLYPT